MHPAHPMKPFAIPRHWSPEQALAVVDLLDELREHIWARYELQLLAEYREQYAPQCSECASRAGEDEEPL